MFSGGMERDRGMKWVNNSENTNIGTEAATRDVLLKRCS